MIAFHFLTVAFILLKVLDVIQWSWWLVLLPSLFPFLIAGFIIAMAGLFGVIAWLFNR